MVNKLGWWIADYDHETKAWYEKSFLISPSSISGTIQAKITPPWMSTWPAPR